MGYKGEKENPSCWAGVGCQGLEMYIFSFSLCVAYVSNRVAHQ